MPPICAVPLCTNSYLQGFTLVRFPKETSVRSLWCKAIGRGKDWVPRPSDRICEVHFHSSDWLDNKKLLKASAVPVLCVQRNKQRKRMPIRIPSVKNLRCSENNQHTSDYSRLKLCKPAVKVKPEVQCDVTDNSEIRDHKMLQKEKDELEVQLQVLKEMLFLKEMELFEQQWVC